MIIGMGIEMIMEILFKTWAIIGCDIAAVKVVDGILPTPLDVMLLGSMILALSPCQLNMNTGSCQGILLVLQL